MTVRIGLPGLQAVAAAAALSFITAGTASAELLYLKKDETFCDSARVLCLNGTLSYNENPRIIELRARILKQTGPGTLRLDMTGTNRNGDYSRTEIVVSVRGKSSEIVRHRMQPDAPSVHNWQLVAMTFTRDSRR